MAGTSHICYATQAELGDRTYMQLKYKDQKLAEVHTPYGHLVKSFQVEQEPQKDEPAAAEPT